MSADIFFLPIENISTRYSGQWRKWFCEAFEKEKRSYKVFGDDKEYDITSGQFLDVTSTNDYKMRQGVEVLRAIQGGERPKVVFFADLWNPFVVNLGYVRDCLGLDFKIKGCLHAGTWDHHDFLFKRKLWKWARGFEQSILNCVDQVFIATRFHEKIIRTTFPQFDCKLSVVDWPVSFPTKDQIAVKKEDIVVFPHRLAEEKDPEMFDKIGRQFKRKFPDMSVKFVKSVEACKTKDEYYDLLCRSKVAVSCAKQETFGIAMAEASVRGCIPVVPDSLSYKELYSQIFRYSEGDVEMAVNLIYSFLKENKSYSTTFKNSVEWAASI